MNLNELLRIVKCVVTIKGKTEDAIKFVRVTGEGDGCIVGYLPRVWMKLPKVLENVNNFCIVSELYSDSENRCKVIKGERSMGMAGVLLLSSIPINNE